MKTTLCIATAIVAAAAPSSARAADEVPSVRVSYADLDLGQPEGRATLYRRLGAAVRTVCPSSFTAVSLHYANMARACRSVAWASARKQVAAVIASSQEPKPADVIAAK